MKMKRFIVALLTICMIATGMIGNLYIARADAGPVITADNKDTNIVLKPGETIHVRLPFTLSGNFIFDPKVKIKDDNENSPFTFTRPVLRNEFGDTMSLINTTIKTYAEFDITVKETAQIKTYPVSLVVDGRLYDDTPCSSSLELSLQILEEKAPAQLTITDLYYDNNMIGKPMDLSFFIKNEGEVTAYSAYISVNYGESGIKKNYTAENIKIGDLAPGEKTPVKLPVLILDNATEGKKTLTANFSYKDLDGNSKTSAYNFQVNILSNTEGPNFDIEEIDYPNDVKPGDEFVLKAVFRNNGETKAQNIKVTVENADTDSIVKNYYTDYLVLSNVPSGEAKELNVPLIAGAAASGNLNKLVLKLTYTDHLGISYTQTKTLYLKVVTDKEEEPAKETSIVIKNVSQKPAKPVAGGNLTVSFEMENKGNTDIKELKVSLEGLTGKTFIPLEIEPYIYIELLKVGETKAITIPLKVSDDIPEGLNYLDLKYSYKGGASEAVKLPVLDVQNALGSGSIPKLIISQYFADVEELRAGSTFNFTFDITNTHSSVSAKNITVTIKKPDTQPEEIFSPTKGSNSFFIEKIAPGETVQKTLEMKVKSDTKTGAYKVLIILEYEFDGYKPKENSDAGYTRNNEITLQAVENARPVVDYVNIYSYDGSVTVGNPAFLSFEFYNMGRSPLNNVIATVEGDFVKADGNMYFLGTVPEGSSRYDEFEVIPNVEGQAKGVLKITYEDSNGDKVEYLKEFEYPVNGAQPFNPDFGFDGGMDVFNPMMPQPKKEILKPWMFIILQILIFVIFLPVTRKVIISVYRRKLQKREEAKY
jgi:hypothetical protein